MSLKENEYPVDKRGCPDLRCYKDSLAYYIQMYEQHLDTLEGRKTGVGYEVHLSFSRRVHATWGLIAKGAEATPYALSLLDRSESEAREDGASILAELGKDAGVVDRLLESLKSERDVTAKDTLIAAIGRLKSGKAIPALATIIRDAAEDGDTRWTAVESLGTIVRRRFLDQKDPIETAIAWLANHPGDTRNE
jgi:hypothetical protein